LSVLLEKLGIVAMLLEMKKKSCDEDELREINKIAKHFDVPERRHI